MGFLSQNKGAGTGGSMSIQDLLGSGYDPSKAANSGGVSPVVGQTPGGDLMINQSPAGLSPQVQASQQQHPYIQALQQILGGAMGQGGGGPVQGSQSNQYPPQSMAGGQGQNSIIQNILRGLQSGAGKNPFGL